MGTWDGDERITAFGLFMEAHRLLMNQFETTLRRVSGLPMQWVDILVRLTRSPDQRERMTDLAHQVGLSPSGLSRAVSRLEERGYITRVDCEDDRRGYYAVLTPAGNEIIDHALAFHVHELEQFFLGPLDEAERATFISSCRKLRDSMTEDRVYRNEPGPFQGWVTQTYSG